MTILWDFTLCKVCDETFSHVFPAVLTENIFQNLQDKYQEREYLHVISRDNSTSYSYNGTKRRYKTKWGCGFKPNYAPVSRQYRECSENKNIWIDTESYILYYRQDEDNTKQYVFNARWGVFGGPNPIPERLRCTEDVFYRYATDVRRNSIRYYPTCSITSNSATYTLTRLSHRITSKSATVCVIREHSIESSHKVTSTALCSRTIVHM
jgi:hypothetical protein